MLTDYDIIYQQELLDCMRRGKVAHHLIRSLERNLGTTSVFDMMCLWFLTPSPTEKEQHISDLIEECQYLGN